MDHPQFSFSDFPVEPKSAAQLGCAESGEMTHLAVQELIRFLFL